MSIPIEKEIWINAPCDVVFEYLTNAEKMVRWCGAGARLDPIPDGIYDVDMGEAGHIAGRFVEVRRPSLVVQEIDSPPGMNLPTSRIEFSLSEEAGGTRLRVVHSGLPDPHSAGAMRGLDHHLARLSVVAQGGDAGADAFCQKPMRALLDGGC